MGGKERHETIAGQGVDDEHVGRSCIGLHRDLLVYDLVYNPVETLLLKVAREQGCRTLSGVKMLVYQGAAAFQLWTGVWPPIGRCATGFTF